MKAIVNIVHNLRLGVARLIAPSNVSLSNLNETATQHHLKNIIPISTPIGVNDSITPDTFNSNKTSHPTPTHPAHRRPEKAPTGHKPAHSTGNDNSSTATSNQNITADSTTTWVATQIPAEGGDRHDGVAPVQTTIHHPHHASRGAAAASSVSVKVIHATHLEPTNTSTHPTFGILLKDLGYKQIYLSSLQGLASLDVWRGQRIYRHERAKAIARDKEKFPETTTHLPGIISAYQIVPQHQHEHHQDRSSNNKNNNNNNNNNNNENIQRQSNQPLEIGLLDGQHRRGALQLLALRGLWDNTQHNIIVELFKFPSEDKVKRLFLEINKAEPIKLVDLPFDELETPDGESGPDLEDKRHKEILYAVCVRLQKQHPNIFSSSSRCRMPHVNIDNLRDDIYQSNLLQKFDLNTEQDLFNFLLKTNQELAALNLDQWTTICAGKKKSVLSKALEKAKANDFYLGMTKSWIYGLPKSI